MAGNGLVSGRDSDNAPSGRRQSRRIEVKRETEQYWLQHNFPTASVLQAMLDGSRERNGKATACIADQEAAGVVKSVGLVAAPTLTSPPPSLDDERAGLAASQEKFARPSSQRSGRTALKRAGPSAAAAMSSNKPSNSPAKNRSPSTNLNGTSTAKAVEERKQANSVSSGKTGAGVDCTRSRESSINILERRPGSGHLGHSPHSSNVMSLNRVASGHHRSPLSLPSSMSSKNSTAPSSVSSLAGSLSLGSQHADSPPVFDDNDDDYSCLSSPGGSNKALSPAMSDESYEFSDPTGLATIRSPFVGVAARELSCIPVPRMSFALGGDSGSSPGSRMNGVPRSAALTTASTTAQTNAWMGVEAYSGSSEGSISRRGNLGPIPNDVVWSASESSDEDDDDDFLDMPPLIKLSDVRCSNALKLATQEHDKPEDLPTGQQAEQQLRQHKRKYLAPLQLAARTNGAIADEVAPLVHDITPGESVSPPTSHTAASESETGVTAATELPPAKRQRHRESPWKRADQETQTLLRDNLAESQRVRRMASRNASARISALVSSTPTPAGSTPASVCVNSNSRRGSIDKLDLTNGHAEPATVPPSSAEDAARTATSRRAQSVTVEPLQVLGTTTTPSKSPMIKLPRHAGSARQQQPPPPPLTTPTAGGSPCSGNVRGRGGRGGSAGNHATTTTATAAGGMAMAITTSAEEQQSPTRQLAATAVAYRDFVGGCRPSRQASQNARAIMALQNEPHSSSLAYPLPKSAGKPHQRRAQLPVTAEKPDDAASAIPAAVESRAKDQQPSELTLTKQQQQQQQQQPHTPNEKPAARSRGKPGGDLSRPCSPPVATGASPGASSASKLPRASTIMRRLTTSLKDSDEEDAEKWKAIDEQHLNPLLSVLNGHIDNGDKRPDGGKKAKISSSSTSSSTSDGNGISRTSSPIPGQASSLSPSSPYAAMSSRQQRASRNQRGSSGQQAALLARLAKVPSLPRTNGWLARNVCNVETETQSGRVRYSFRSLEHRRRDMITVGRNVLLSAGKHRAPYVATLQQITQEEDKDIMLLLSWFYRATDLPPSVEVASSFSASSCGGDISAQLFSSEHSDMNSASALIGRCYVTAEQDYSLYRARHKRHTLGIRESAHSTRLVPELRHHGDAVLRPAHDLDGCVPAATERSKVFYCNLMFDHRAIKLRQRRDIHSRIVQPTQAKRKHSSRMDVQ